jgi:hypothetical protein
MSMESRPPKGTERGFILCLYATGVNWIRRRDGIRSVEGEIRDLEAEKEWRMANRTEAVCMAVDGCSRGARDSPA